MGIIEENPHQVANPEELKQEKKWVNIYIYKYLIRVESSDGVTYLRDWEKIEDTEQYTLIVARTEKILLLKSEYDVQIYEKFRE